MHDFDDDRDSGALPCSIDAEQAVLGGLMLAPAALAQVSDWLTADDFFRRDHQMVYRAIVALSERDTPCDAVTLSDWFVANGITVQGGPAYLFEIANATPSATNIAAYGEIVLEKARLRRLVVAGRAITAAAFKRGARADEIVAVATHDLSDLAVTKLADGLQPARTALIEFHTDIAASYARGSGLIGIASPWDAINERLMGFEDENVYLVAARPSMGKSVFAGGVAFHAALSGESTLIFSPEMSAKQYMRRAAAAYGRIPFSWLRSPHDHPDSEMYWDRLTKVTALLRDIPLQIDATPGLSIEQFEARASREHLRRPVRMIVVDHVHEMFLDPNQPPRIELGRIMAGFRRVAKKLRCPVLAMAQLSRKLTDRADKRPIMSDLRESGELEQKADVIGFLHREDYYDKETYLKGVVEFIFGKGRDLETGDSIPLLNRFDEMRMENWVGDMPSQPMASQQPRSSWGRKKGGLSYP